MKAFISQPMKGLSDDEIVIVRDSVWRIIKEKHGEECEIIESYSPNDELYNSMLSPIESLARSITFMSDADVAYFAPGWDEARGCIIEHAICEFYGIPHTELEDL